MYQILNPVKQEPLADQAAQRECRQEAGRWPCLSSHTHRLPDLGTPGARARKTQLEGTGPAKVPGPRHLSGGSRLAVRASHPTHKSDP